MKLVNKLHIAIMLPVVIGGIAAFAVGFTFNKAALEAEAEAQARLLLGVHAHGIQDFFQQHVNTLEVLAASRVFQGRERGEIIEQLRAWQAHFADAEAMGYMEPDGTMYGTVGTPFTVTDRAYYPVIKRGDSVVGQIIVSRGSGKEIIHFMVPVLDQDGRWMGGLAVAVERTHLAMAVSNMGIGETGFGILMDDAGNLISGAASPEAAASVVEALGEQRSEEPLRLSVDGEPCLVYRSPVRGTEWSLVLVYKEAEALARVRQWNLAAAIILAMAAGMALMGSAALRRLLSPPVRHLMDIQRRIARGDTSARATLTSKDEFGALARSFNEMADAVEAASSQLRESEELFRSQFELGHIGMAIVSPDKRCLRANHRLCGMLGYSEEELLQMPWVDITHPDDIAFSIEPLEMALAGKVDFYELDKRFIHKEGHAVDVHLTVACQRNPDGSPRFLLVSVLDITERKRAEEERSRLSEILEQTTDLVATATPDGHITYLNRAGRRMLGIGQAEGLVGRTVAENHPEWASRIIFEQAIPTACEVGVWQGEDALLSRDGTEIPVSQVLMAHRAPNGDLLYLSTIMHDISERKKQEEAIRASERRFRAIVENSSESIILVNETGDIIEWNPGAERIGGIPREEALGAKIWDAVYKGMLPERKTPERMAAIRESFDLALHGDKAAVNELTGPDGSIAIRRRDGQVRYLLQATTAIPTDKGTMLALTSRDITRHRQDEEAIRKRSDELAALNRLARAVTEKRSLQDACQAAVQEVAQALDVPLTLLFVREEDELLLKACGAGELGKYYGKGPNHMVGECLCGLALQTGQPAYSLDVSRDERCTWEECKAAGIHSFAAIPLRLGEDTIGILGVGSTDERDFRLVVPFLETAADQLAVTINNVHLYEETRDYASQLQHAMAEREVVQQALQRREKEARQANLMLRNVLDTIPVRVFWKDRESRFIGCNALFARDVGFDHPRDVIGKDDYAVAPPDQAERYRADDCGIMDNGQARLAYEEPRRTADGRDHLLRTSKVPLRNEQGETIGVLGTYEDITEQKRAQDALAQSQRQLQDIAANVPGVIYQFFARPDGVMGLHYVSAKAKDVLGLDTRPDDFFERFAACVTENDRGRFLGSVNEALKHAAPWHFEGEFIKPTGESVWISGTASPQPRANELLYNGVLMDITDIKRAELGAAATLERVERQKDIIAQVAVSPSVAAGAIQELAREVTEAMGTAFEAERSCVWLFTKDNTAIECIDLYERTPGTHSSGLTLSEPQYQVKVDPLKDVRYVAADDPMHDPRLSIYTEGYVAPHNITAVLAGAIRVSGRNLGVLSLEHVNKPHHWESDEIAFVCQLADQIALAIVNRERGNAEAALREGEEKFRTIFESSPYHVAINDLDHRFIDVNSAICASQGLTREEIIGRKPSEIPGLYQIQDEEELRLTAGRLMKDGVIRNEEVTVVRPSDGTTREMILSASLVTIAGRRCILSMMADVTERKRLEDQLRQSQKMEAIGQLAGGVAHDFNNLLQAILGYTDMSLELIDPEDDHYNDLVEIRRAGERAAALTRQLLAFSRRQVLELAVLDLNQVIEDIMKMIRRLIGENIELAIMPGHAIAPVNADRSQVEQILLNLCVNARDAMPEGGRLTIETRNFPLDEDYCAVHEGVSPGPHVLLSVSDSGCGMDQETQRQIFEPFFTTKEAGKGTGLGLATVYGIVRQHGGLIQVYSEVGKGTRFNIILPAMEHVGDDADQDQEEPVVGGTETILLAEDEEQVRTLAQRILERAGYHVLSAEDGEAAVELYHQHADAIDFLLLDVVMPKKGGRAVLDEVAASRPGVKCLFVSGYSENAITDGFVLETGLRLLHKPYAPKDLLRAVRDTLDA